MPKGGGEKGWGVTLKRSNQFKGIRGKRSVRFKRGETATTGENPWLVQIGVVEITNNLEGGKEKRM